MNILVTGANEGIGYYMVLELLLKGNNVTILDVKTNALSQIQQEYGWHILLVECDVRNHEKMEMAIKQSVEQFGSIDIAIHNACRCTFESLEETTYETYHDVFEVNYFGALRLAKIVIPYMKKAGKGKIIFTTSGVGITGFYNISPYSSTKGAIESLAKCLRLEYKGTGITFHLFHPPLTQTRSADSLPVPKELKARPEVVGKGLAQRISKKSFVICHSSSQQILTKICYLFPLKMGEFMTMMTRKFNK